MISSRIVLVSTTEDMSSVLAILDPRLGVAGKDVTVSVPD